MKRIILPVFLVLIFLTVIPVGAQTLFWTINSRESVLRGDSKGVAVDDTGRISRAPVLSGSFKTNEQFVWSSAGDRNGIIYLGTGGNGKVFKVDKSGTGTLLFDSEELNVSALAIGGDGSLFAATSPDGKVYKIDNAGRSSVYFEPKSKYIWSLAVDPAGALFVGTGETGRIYRVSGPGVAAASALFYDSRETHIISLTTDAKGYVYAGTDESGLVLKIGPDKKAFAILDSSLREIHEVSIGPDGSVYALALSESVSAKTPEANEKEGSSDKTVSVDKPDPAAPPVPPAPSKSRYDTSTAKSVIYRVAPNGTGDIIWNSETTPAFSIAADPAGGGVFVGTSEKGRIFRISNDARESLLVQTEEEQISTLLTLNSEIVATTSNKGRTFRFGKDLVSEGIYESPVLDAQSSARWGRVWSEKNGPVVLETRSGNSARPGQAWSDWSPANSSNGKISSPSARFLQWRARFTGSGQSSVGETTVSFAALNIAPEILSIEVLPPNVGLAPNPPIPVDPNIETLGLNPGDFGLAIVPVPPRRVFQSGARAIQWKATDRNGDALRYKVFLSKADTNDFRQVGEVGQSDFLTLDGLSLGDGRYVVKISADDFLSNGSKNGKYGDRISEPFEIDNTAPEVVVNGTPVANGDTLTVRFSATEKSSFIKRAEFSINGGGWYHAYPDDGIVDGQTESFTVDAKTKGIEKYVIAIRVFDAVGNIGSVRIVK